MSHADLLNEIANEPEVLEGIAPLYREVDLSRFLEEPRNLCCICISEFSGAPRGALLFGWLGDDRYELHYLYTALLRGKDALIFTRACLRTMFLDYDALAITGATPRENRAARAMNRALGARPTGELVDSQGRACIRYLLERKTWATSLAES